MWPLFFNDAEHNAFSYPLQAGRFVILLQLVPGWTQVLRGLQFCGGSALLVIGRLSDGFAE